LREASTTEWRQEKERSMGVLYIAEIQLGTGHYSAVCPYPTLFKPDKRCHLVSCLTLSPLHLAPPPLTTLPQDNFVTAAVDLEDGL
jgi:hypothetical protein